MGVRRIPFLARWQDASGAASLHVEPAEGKWPMHVGRIGDIQVFLLPLISGRLHTVHHRIAGDLSIACAPVSGAYVQFRVRNAAMLGSRIALQPSSA